MPAVSGCGGVGDGMWETVLAQVRVFDDGQPVVWVVVRTSMRQVLGKGAPRRSAPPKPGCRSSRERHWGGHGDRLKQRRDLATQFAKHATIHHASQTITAIMI